MPDLDPDQFGNQQLFSAIHYNYAAGRKENAGGAGKAAERSVDDTRRSYKYPTRLRRAGLAVMRLTLQAIAAALILLAGAQASRAQNADLSNKTCLSCHGQASFSTKLAGGRTRELFVAADHFARSVHGKLQCTSCHSDITAIPHTSPAMPAAAWRQQAPKICGTCHAAELNDYESSIHGKQVTSGSNVYAAVCTDCHTTHAVAPASAPATRLAITKACGTCHGDAATTYEETFHGQMFALGYANVAMCSDCHRGHAILPASDPASSVGPANRLATCRACHAQATAGFVSFTAHAAAHDFVRYPYMYLTAVFMFWLVALTLAVVWLHSALWLYAELRDRLLKRPRPHVRAAALPAPGTQQVRRWTAGWRLTHLIFAISVIVLVMTGLPLLYPNSAWAPWLDAILGGDEIRPIVHRIAAVVMLAIFAGHLVYVAVYLARNWKSVKLFGPYSMLPTWQDLNDVIAMGKWFAGTAPRPLFDHWNYQQKFDYWGVFWGVTLLAVTGFMLWFKDLTMAVLPGFLIGPATLAHGHECILAAVYLFTIHYFVNHWRPDKFPLDIVIFTGSMPLEEFKREFGAEYDRLVDRGELEQYLVQAPSRPMTVASTILGFGLILVSLVLLVFIFNGGFLSI
jgi:cytochrome b subunit of formate dehydrogenase